jgi:spoIIIJ-associated protein
LQNQEDAVRKYLQTIRGGLTASGKGQTKVLDGVLVQIALHELRKTFPDKNVVIKLTPEGGRFVSVSPFLKKHEA